MNTEKKNGERSSPIAKTTMTTLSKIRVVVSALAQAVVLMQHQLHQRFEQTRWLAAAVPVPQVVVVLSTSLPSKVVQLLLQLQPVNKNLQRTWVELMSTMDALRSSGESVPS